MSWVLAQSTVESSEYLYNSEGNYFSIGLTIRNNTTDADLGVHAKNQQEKDTDCTQIRP